MGIGLAREYDLALETVCLGGPINDCNMDNTGSILEFSAEKRMQVGVENWLKCLETGAQPDNFLRVMMSSKIA